MDFGKAFSYVSEDSDWLKKIGLGGVIAIVPILNFAVAGYSLEVSRRVINNEPRPLPEWDDIGGKLVKGFLVAVIGLVYGLPNILLSCVSQAAAQAPQLLSSGSSQAPDQTILTIVMVVTACFGCLSFLYGVFMALVLPAAIGNYAAKGQLSAAFRFGEVLRLVQKNIGTYLMVLLISIAAGIVAALGLIACVIGVIFTAFYSQLVMGHAIGQAYREASANVGLV